MAQTRPALATARPAAAPGERTRLQWLLLAAGATVIVGVAVLAAMGPRWSWTGFGDNDNLWSWLKLLAQPVAFAALPLLLLSRDRWSGPWRLGLTVVVGGLVVTAFGGYLLSWTWTGFAEKRMWDWLNLLLFPTVLFLLPGWARQVSGFSARAGAYATAATIACVIVVIGGYSWGWAWTGFTGNTFRDWLGLLIAPFLVPACFGWMYTRRRMQNEHSAEAPSRPAPPLVEEPQNAQPMPTARETR